MTITVEFPELLLEADPEAKEADTVAVAPERSELQKLAALLAQSYVAMPLFV